VASGSGSTVGSGSGSTVGSGVSTGAASTVATGVGSGVGVGFFSHPVTESTKQTARSAAKNLLFTDKTPFNKNIFLRLLA
jgi:hypothetical protein